MMKKALLILLLFLFFAVPLQAQEGTSITIFVDSETLVVYIPGNSAVNLNELGLEVVNSEGERKTYYLESYNAFSSLNFASLPAPLCFRFEVTGNQNPLPQECPTSRTLTTRLALADVFWFDSVAKQSLTFSIVQGVNSIGFCAAGVPSCEVILGIPSVTSASDAPTAIATSTDIWQPVTEEIGEFEMVQVPAGCFILGGERRDEQPQQEICFDQDFWLDKYEVSHLAFINSGGVAQNPNAWNNIGVPRGNVTWFEAQAFCELRGGRLPTEAEWEYAARGPDNLVYPWGNTFIPENSIYKDTVRNGQPENVDTFPQGASWVGAFHMAGNMLEWTSSIDAPYPYDATDGREDLSNKEDRRVIRGGSWLIDPVDMRLANRNSQSPNYYLDYLGFRCLVPFE